MDGFVLSSSHTLRVYGSVLETIGKTPLVRLNQISEDTGKEVFAKIEFYNPGGSVKDRIGLNIIEEAERKNQINPGGTIVESTSGNTGVGLAIACAIKGYKAIFVMPDKMSQEKIQLLRAFGAKVIITPTAVAPGDPRSYYSVANKIVKETPNSILANQYHNPENPRSHYETTGPEIWEQTQGKVTDVIIGIGTGGTITGVGKYLKEMNPEIQIVGVDPVGSILMETWQNKGVIPGDAIATTYKVEGIGEDFLPGTLDLSVVDHVIKVSDKESFLWARRLVRMEGVFGGGSSGSAIAGTIRYAKNLPGNRLLVVLLPDSGSRYLSKFYDDKWMRENGFLDSEWAEMTLAEALNRKPSRELYTAYVHDPISSVIRLMKEKDISQLPVVGSNGLLSGLVTEVDLLNRMLDSDHHHTPGESIESVIRPVLHVHSPFTMLEEILPTFMEDQLLIVAEEGKPIGILTKIDILDFLSQNM